MAGKSNRGRNRKGSAEPPSSNPPSNDSPRDTHANGDASSNESTELKSEVKDKGIASHQHPSKQAEVHLYPVSVKTQGGEKLELQLSPGDSVMDVRQFLLDAPETCFCTCYDLLLHTKDGSVQHLEDYNEICEVADITSGSCFLEMVPALYDDRSVRAHVHRTRELISLSTLHSSLSTTLALQHEIGKNAYGKSDVAKAEVPELDNLGFMDVGSGSLINLLSSSSKEIKCVESIVFSSLNPPPSYRRLSGDLIYLDMVTLEGNKYCITGTTKAFYVNSSLGNVLDPRPNKSAFEATTLVGLLQKISPKFKKAFREILEQKASAHPFENVQSLLQPNSWIGSYPVPDHKRDGARAENSLTLSFGSELIGMQRDWNEELQSCREFPHATHQERILRDRALYKVTSDFVDAATSGAIGVISRCIPPINPTDPDCFHMYVHNNIFFSFAVDADLEQLSRKQSSEDNSKTDNVASIQSSSEKKYNNVPQGASRFSDADESVVCDTENNNDINALSPDMPAEAQLAESEQATYASANNDLRGTKAYQEADVPGLYNLAMAIIDYRGHRVVAQSVLPGILQGDKSESLLYGSVDNGKKICWSEDFHSKVLEAAKRLHLKENTVLDGSGKVFKLAAPVECKGIVGSDDRDMPHLWDLCSTEIVVRSAKHIIKDILRDTEDHDLGHAMSHFFNCFCGTVQSAPAKGVANNTPPKNQKKDHIGHHVSGKSPKAQTKFRAYARKKQSSYLSITSESLWFDIQEFSKLKYQFELPKDARLRVRKISVLRNLCQKVGITLAAHKFDLDSPTPFQVADILNLQPVMKHSIPVCSEAKELVETGKIQLAEGMLSEAYTLFSEAFAILQQVTGPMHREVANCCRYLAMVLYHAGDMAGAIMQQHKELIINERCLGLDHPDTAHSYGNMALFYHGLNQTELALRHMSRALLLLGLSSGPDHPDVAATFINVAMMYQDIGKMDTALRYLQEALKKNERLLGEEHIQTAVCYHALAIAFNCMGAFKLSHQHEKKTYDILVKQLGEDDSRTRDSQNWMNTFKMREAQMTAQKQKGQALNAASAQKAIDILKAHPDLIHAFQAAAGGNGAAANKSFNSAIIGEALPRGRGVDERAARAAAEARKKAAARGLLTRPHGVPVQALPPLNQFLNIINSGTTPDAVGNNAPDGEKKDANSNVINGKPDSKENLLKPGQQDQAPPVGLGSGLAALDAKKQKSKAKASS
ncbi:clustered mitochondria protein-like isoform X2 [Primulina eburnea]|uniref:clustered mitochondria protein-like isoform X2 n=1 Tax=Primulina eburnea TaxID=1245227 RepID=UPI003C6BD730